MNDDVKCSHCGTRFGDKTAGCDACNPHNIEEARQRVLQVIPHLRYAMKDAAKEAGEGGTVEIGILAVKHDGSGGRVVCRFNAGEFWEDLALVVNAPRQTEESEMDAKAQQLVDAVRASGATIVSEPVK